MTARLRRIGSALGGAIDWLDAQLRRWPIAGLALLILTLLIAGTLVLRP